MISLKNDKRHFKNAIYEQIARIGKAISSPKRLELLDLLYQVPKTVESLARETEMSVANVSQHLQTLREARLVESHKEGNFVFYRLADPMIAHFILNLRNVAENRLTEIQHIYNDFFLNKDAMEPMDVKTLLERVKDGDVTLLDVRPKEEYEEGHIPGAISIPVEELEQQLSTLSKEQEIIAYCRGRYCVFSLQAIDLLRSHGYKAVRLEEGIQEWMDSHYPLEGVGSTH